ncbi:hypothetical protein BP5796_07266 [Coleophoma crateriformis]|uniref:ubiquitinyl hydrolase 1 n=1 Tax=Coleophoma crateriformis TaxID=565419 RepID=A0A3D8RIV4_9HELO|nr:hypothetical protein BP5796_07266 [Coleophoma crateriformis]
MGDAIISGRPGKTTPRLVADLIDYDPQRRTKNKKNLLADPAEWYRSTNLPPLRRGDLDCKHSLFRKDGQTRPPASDDEVPGPESEYVVAAYCSNCKHHFEIYTSFKNAFNARNICGKGRPNPLHHLVLEESTYPEAYKETHGESKYDTITEAHTFVCSAAECRAEVMIKISPPRLGKKLLALIEDTRKVDIRGRTVIAGNPERYADQRPMSPAAILGVLLQYLRDAKAKDPNEVKKIAIRNKKFRICFADECDSLFEYLDFTRYEEGGEDPDEEPNLFWKLPEVTDTNRNFIDDVVYEVYQRLNDRPAKEKVDMRTVIYAPIPALRDIERSLGFHDYETRMRAIQLDALEEHPYYANLGATENFTDSYLGWAYDQQVRCDPANKPYYFDCLQDLAKGRKSDDLQEKVVMASSLGELGLQEIENAYKYFSLDPAATEGDDHIIGVFNSRIQAAPLQKDEAKRLLLVIGKARSSEKIQQVANDRTMSPDEALTFLGVTHNTPYDSIEASAIVMALDGDKSQVAASLRVISKYRGGIWALERAAHEIDGHGQLSLSLEEAYIKLQAKPEMPDSTIWMYYSNLHDGAGAASKESYEEALRAIAQDRQSVFLLAKLEDPNTDIQALPANTDQPVGLDNIGNTCYLNSLLQYYYTVKAVRDIVIDFPNHRMALTAEDIRKKRVGGRVVDKSEIIKAQKFVDELHNLFENLKTASTRSVKPTRELAELTIFSSAAEANFRRASVSSPTSAPVRPSITEPILGAAPPMPVRPSPAPNSPLDNDIEMVDGHDKEIDQDDDSSEATLIDLEKEKTDGDEVSTNAPNDSTFSDRHSMPNNDLDGDAVMVNGAPLTPPQSPQAKAPPVPPRNKAGLSIKTGEIKLNDDLWRFGTQQDVTEVIGNVLFRLQCAIRPTSIDEDGGQRDSIKDTFYGSNAVYLQKAEKLEKKVEEWNSLIVPPAQSGTRDIYDALDVVFDEQPVEVNNTIIPQFTSIHKLPPILQIWINRTDFNQATQRAWKNTNAINFPETLYLDRYMDSDDLKSSLMQRRKDAWLWKNIVRKCEARLQALDDKSSASLNVEEALEATRDYLRGIQEDGDTDIDIDLALPGAIEERVNEIKMERSRLQTKVSKYKQKLQEQFTNLRTHRYQLHTVFIHRGEASSGHYWIYIYDFDRDIWREYNDDHVSIVQDRNRIFDPEKGNGGTPYFLSYVKQPDLVDAVHREISEVPPTAPQAVIDLDADMPDLLPTYGQSFAKDEQGEVEHVERVKPAQRELRPKPAENSWEDPGPRRDSNGKPW